MKAMPRKDVYEMIAHMEHVTPKHVWAQLDRYADAYALTAMHKANGVSTPEQADRAQDAIIKGASELVEGPHTEFPPIPPQFGTSPTEFIPLLCQSRVSGWKVWTARAWAHFVPVAAKRHDPEAEPLIGSLPP